jgi:hypothetical protein
LGGTYENPKEMNDKTGFTNELQRIDMIKFKDVITKGRENIFGSVGKFKKSVLCGIMYLLVLWGAMNSSAFITHYEGMKDVGFVTVSSPLPLVFSAYNGQETYSTGFTVNVTYENGTSITDQLDATKYDLLGGAYNRRNIYGAIFSHGPFFDKPNLIKMRQQILAYAVCDPAPIIKEFGFDGRVKEMVVDVLDRPNNNAKVGELRVTCPLTARCT